MPRRNRQHRGRPDADRAGAASGWARAESGPDGDWLVRSVPGSHATKVYRCPGCDHEIQPGVPHVVAWPAGELGSITDRRHWHRACWQARDRRGPTRKRF
ncbi:MULTISPECIES: hypothetical protein [Amycolatopsis]|uniref:ATP/GTP-binding protein n=1 Tax=Amycolatopsis thermalba TaxID=944492 RepID=A0ABY4NSL5_9PSEU|nr:MULTISPECIES: hypothetical protein [Amycolatopsis]OXM69222.1 hypothetical protein CF166_21555 [Amycolatopsis sp. KNN50.9b]UQS23048.1 ATP/GTP-binding protein [Amycolatopsis thermalba]